MHFTISEGLSRKDKVWKNVEITWEEFLKKAGTPRYTSETVSEYKRLQKDMQDDIKDVGGFVGGKLKEGRRKNGYVEYRSMLTLDMDHCIEGIWDRITGIFNFSCCVYSTHKHTSESPRLRLIIPLSRNVSPDEYEAVARMVASDIGIEQFDDTTYEPARLMYWTSTSRDGELVFEKQDGDFLDPDVVLSRYSNWRDRSSWPVSSRQGEVVEKNAGCLEDPCQKGGVVGAFCRAYSIEDAILKFLPDVYRINKAPGRYDYISADSTGGLVLYGRFCYSFHATDPACGKLLNAFDLVRIHKFISLDSKDGKGTPSSRLPSYMAMQELCINDGAVKMELAKCRKVQDEPMPEDGGEGWQLSLELARNGEIKDTLSNIVTIIRNDRNLSGIAYNLHRDGIDVRRSLPWKQVKEGWNDSDAAGAKVYFDSVYRLWSPAKFRDALLAVAAERAYHPVREYLDSLPGWDNVHRLDTLLVDYLGAEDTSYTRAVTRKTLCAAVTRIYEPGTKFDCTLVLNGPQGIGKSTLLSRLGGRWFSDSLTISDMRDKTAAEKLQGYWLLELGELAGIKKIDVETVKSFISRTDDKYRASYGFNVESHLRQCIFVGSTNCESGFLRDITGNRRFWPVRVDGRCEKKPWDLKDVDQVWAEALVKYREKEELFLTGDEEKAAALQQCEAMEHDDREGLVREYLEKLLPPRWKDMDLYERRNFLNGRDFGGGVKGTESRERVCTMEIWCECFGREASDLRRSDAYEINAIMAKINGYKKYDGSKRGNFRFPIYGSQIAYVRDTGENL